MELILERIAKRKTYTIGRLYIQSRVDDEYLAGTENQYFCDTLEPTWRDYANGAYKVKGRSAIPEGRYAVVISWSPKFQQWLPILQMRHVPKTDTVGYSRKGKLERDSVIAAIPIGYADGLNRHLGNRHCYCLVNGQKAEYVGNICMDVALIDVTDIPCKEGDQVEIFGEHLPVTVLSDVLDTIPYEVLTGISNRVKRVYFQD